LQVNNKGHQKKTQKRCFKTTKSERKKQDYIISLIKTDQPFKVTEVIDRIDKKTAKAHNRNKEGNESNIREEYICSRK